MPAPYVQDPNTGKSRTRDFVLAFLEGYSGPTESRRSVYDTIFGDMPVVQEAMFGSEPGHRRGKRIQKCGVCPDLEQCIHLYSEIRVGRASHATSGKNRNEDLWCLRLDVKNACLRLTRQQRNVLGLRYILDWGEETSADVLGVSVSTVARAHAAAITKLVEILDRTG